MARTVSKPRDITSSVVETSPSLLITDQAKISPRPVTTGTQSDWTMSPVQYVQYAVLGAMGITALITLCAIAGKACFLSIIR